MKLTTYLVRGIYLLLSMITCIQVSSAQCDTNCEMQCIGQINVSLDQTCMTEITPAMGGNNIDPACNSEYTVKLYDENGVPLPGTVVGIEQNGKLITYQITENECGNKCWGKAFIEYKYPPQIECPDDLTVACGVVDLLDLPPATGGCADFDVVLLSQEKNLISCDPDYSSSIVRTYKATDEFGNYSTCSHTIFIERVDISDIIFPNDATISCSDTLIRFNENGFPIPWINHPLTGSGSGVPIICDPFITDGVYCVTNDDFSGVPLIPAGGAILINEIDGGYSTEYEVVEVTDDNNAALCNAILTYTDVEIPNVPCKRKFVRTWNVREWWCNQEFSNGDLQLITIVDDQAPHFTCPNDYTVSTDYECGGHVYLQPIEAYDVCDSELNYFVEYNSGVLNTNGGYVDLNLGTNVLNYVVSDGCYNQSSCQVTVTVRDNTEPVAVCEQFKVISISQSAQTLVFAEPFDNGSWDECGLDRFEVRRMDSLCVAADTLFGESVNFCCSDVNRDVRVVFRAYDWSGNYNDCMVTVDVQDKIAPELTCPEDRAIDCEEGYDINYLGLTFGEATVTDNCSETQEIHETVIADVSQCGVGIITRRFEILRPDSSVLASCKQSITVNNTSVFNPDNIIWPLNYEISDVCQTNDLDPQDLPDLHNYPVFPFQECTLLGYNHEDKMFTSPGGCIRIERYWTVINWCGTSDVGFDQFTSPTPQIIDIVNMTPPEIAPADSLFFESINISCLGDTVEIERTAMDDCDFLIWSYDIYDSADTIIYSGDTNYINVMLPVGEFHIVWRVEDGCGNSDTDTQYVSMINVKAPTPVCINGLSVNLVGMDLDSNGVVDAEMVEIWASDFDSGSSHSCGNPIVLSLSSDTTHKSTFFDCSHIGMTEVQLWATDALTGYQDFCRTYIEVLDNNQFDICNDSITTVTLSGDVFDENKRMIEGVEVVLANTSSTRMTDDSGQYAFENMPGGGSYEVVPMKNTDPLNGISTLDLVYIQRHILGLEKIESPYKLIAADINKSDAITAIDLIELRKLILGINQEIPTNLSWRFIEAEFEFVEPNNPWVSELPESYYIPQLVKSEKVDFIGVKIGDVNNSVITSLNDVDIDSRSNDVKKFEFSYVYTDNGILNQIEVFASEDYSLDGMQGTIELSNLNFVNMTSNQVGLNDGNFNKVNDNSVVFSFVNDYPVEINTNEPLFTINVNVTESFGRSSFDINSSQLKAELYSSKEVYNVDLQEKGQIDDNYEITIAPNPWSGSTTLSFNLAGPENVEISFFDVTGRRLHNTLLEGQQGINRLIVDKSQLNAEGLVYVRVFTKSGIKELKMIVL